MIIVITVLLVTTLRIHEIIYNGPIRGFTNMFKNENE